MFPPIDERSKEFLLETAMQDHELRNLKQEFFAYKVSLKRSFDLGEATLDLSPQKFDDDESNSLAMKFRKTFVPIKNDQTFLSLVD